MVNKILKDFFDNISIGRNFLSFSRNNPHISGIEKQILKNIKDFEEGILSYKDYEKFFDIIKNLGLREDISIETTKDSIIISCSIMRPIIEKENKVIIVCHGVSNNRWNMFYYINIFLQMGYKVVIYDARNHGLSQSSYNTLGKIESDDLEDIVEMTIKKLNPEKIGFCGFSMGAATLLFWLSKFQEKNKNIVSFLICEAPFDNFSERFKNFLEFRSNNKISNIFIKAFINNLLNSPIELEKINPIEDIPDKIFPKLLLLHGMEDKVINYKSSINIFEKVKKNNPEKVNIYLFKGADHSNLAFFGDFAKNSLYWKKGEKESSFTFSKLIKKFLKKNF